MSKHGLLLHGLRVGGGAVVSGGNEYSVVVHGGASDTPPPETRAQRQEALDRATADGLARMRRGGSALDAVEAAVHVLEDAPHFNAGTGSVLTLQGAVEMDAGVGLSTGQLGAVACVERIQYPITLARWVMEKTDHTMLAGAGAMRFARTLGMPDYDPITPARREKWAMLVAALREDVTGRSPLPELRHWKRLGTLAMELLKPDARKWGTVGAVARDPIGLIAAATSTGGIWLKLPGRVGDTPIYGAGFYADANGGCSATGHGEGITRLLLCQRAVARMTTLPAQQAVTETIAEAKARGVECGLIGIDAHGQIGTAFNTEQMLTSTGTSPSL